MSIHRSHPFAEPPDQRQPWRRLRGQIPAGVWVMTAAEAHVRAGLTVSSVTLVDGDPKGILVLVDPESDLAALLRPGRLACFNLLASGAHEVAEIFAGRSPAPGGPFTQHAWQDSEYGPVLTSAAATVMAEVRQISPMGYSLVIEAGVHEFAVGESAPLVSVRGRYAM